MAWKKIVFERQKLFDEVWEVPMNRLAQTYSLSDVGLRKICLALDIPLPPRGYWARLAAGKLSKKPKLHETTGSRTYEHVRHEAEVDEALNARIALARASTPTQEPGTADYFLPSEAQAFQSQTAIITKAMKKATLKDGALSICGAAWVDNSVSPALVERAVVLVDRGAYELQVLGAQFESSHPTLVLLRPGARRDPPQKRNCFNLHGHQFFLRVREKITAEPVPKEPPKNQHRRSGWEFQTPQYRYIRKRQFHRT